MIIIINMNISDTFQRRVILDELSRVKTHPTADEVYEMARSRVPNISLATVYRNLELMSRKRVINRLDSAGRKRRYDFNSCRHYHMRCEGCGSLRDIELKEMREIESLLESLKGNEGILDFNLEFTGLCKQCSGFPEQKKKGRII